LTIVTPADSKSVAAIEKLIGQTIPWAGEPVAPVASREEPAVQHPPHREHRPQPPRGQSRNADRNQNRSQGRNPGRPAATVAPLEPKRPRPERPRAQAEDADQSHLPAFLLRPVRI
jgi:hypothetical protein